MKRIIYLSYILSIIICMGSCADDWEQKKVVVSDGQIQLSFGTSIPEPQEIATRGVDQDGWGIQTLWLFTFNKDGIFIGRSLATMTSGNVTDAERGFTATVSSETRIVHLLANQNLDGIFNDNANQGLHENVVMTGLVSTSGMMIYWGRVDLSEVEKPEEFAVQFAEKTIPMFRNQARISYDTNLPSGLSIEGFSVCNTYLNGTSIPFNSVTNSFDWENKWIGAPYVTTPVNHIKATELEEEVDTEPQKHIFETPNTGEDEVYLIFKCTKNGTVTRYYKVALIDDNKDPLPIYRNYEYKVHFDALPAGEGSPDFTSARTAAPLNNVWVSVSASIPSIGNKEEGTLSVEKTTVIFNSGGEKALNYTYIKGMKENPAPTVTWISDDGVTASERLENTFDSATGKGTIVFDAKEMAEGEVHRGTLQIKVGPLVRYIKVVTVKTFSFTPVWCSTGIYNGAAKEDVAFTFTIPDTYPEELFPLRCLISTNKLSGNGVIKLDVIYPTDDEGNPTPGYGDEISGIGYKYVYEAEKAGMQRIYFQTNYKTNLDEDPNGNIVLEAENFEKVTKTYAFTDRNNHELKVVNAVSYEPELGESDGTVVYYYLVPQQKGAEVTFQLREGVNASENSGFLDAGTNIVIYTSNLEPAPEMVSKFTKGESNLGSGTYWYYTSVNGPDNLKFVTTKANSAEVIRFASATKESSGDYKSCSVELANYGEWMFNMTASPSAMEYKIGTPVTLTFDTKPFKSNPEHPGNWPEYVDQKSGYWCYITTSNLEPADNDNKLVKTSDGYCYLVTDDDLAKDQVTLQFRTTKIVSAEKISIRSDETISYKPEELVLTNVPLTGDISVGGAPLGNNTFVTLERKDGTRIGVVTLTDGGSRYSIKLRGEYNYGWDEEIYVKSTINNTKYECSTSLESLNTNKEIILTQK